MATLIGLINFTDQGIRGIKETTKRAEAATEVAKKFGIKISQVYWTLGRYDLVLIADAPDEASGMAWALAMGMTGNTRSESLRGFSAQEMNSILAKLG